MVRREYKKREKIKAATFEFSQSKLQYLIEYQGKNGRPDKRFDKSLEGHSDADVGFHSLVDAILGAIGKGDIGEHLPPSEKKWKNKNSLFFLEYAASILDDEKFKINNLDLTIICEKPKISKYKEKMKK